MRLIGNKRRLLADIERFLRERGVRGGTLIDVFSGTASVGRHFKSRGYKVIANDRLAMCYTKAIAEVEVSRCPSFAGLREKYASLLKTKEFRASRFRQGELFAAGGERAAARMRAAPDAQPLEHAIHFLDRWVEPREGFIFRNYCPGGHAGRMYFRDENGRRLDGMLEFLRENHRDGTLARPELHLLLSSILDAADRVANISGTYGAYLKTWQRSALAPITLVPPQITPSRFANQAHDEDANELVRRVRGAVLYIDPPYNHRQYAANYHVLEIIAEHHRIDDLDAYEAGLYGKTGLKPYAEQKSAYCVEPGTGGAAADARSAMTDLIMAARVDHVVVSYNEEGLLTREEIAAMLARFAGEREFDFARNMESVLYRRFRSDSDRFAGHARGKREYKVLAGKKRNEIAEWLFFASRRRRRAGTVAARAGSS